MIDAIHHLSWTVFRALPHCRGRGSAALLVNRSLLRSGATPVVCTRMRAGHRLILDSRVQAQTWALYDGGYDETNQRALISALRPGGTALDVGANVGLWTIPLAIAAGSVSGKVVAIEPLPANAKRLRENIALNGLDGIVTLFSCAVGTSSGTAVLTLREDFAGGGEVGNAAICEAGTVVGSVNVPVRTIDALWPNGSARVDAIKLDIEGFEIAALLGARELLARDRPTILSEVNRWFYRQRKEDLDATLMSALPVGYRPWTCATGWIDGISNVPDGNDVFLIPTEREAEFPSGGLTR